jgi:hypothetical protein
VRVAPIGRIKEQHRDVIAEIASELLRIEGTSIAIAIAVTERGTEVSVRADSRLLGDDRHLLGTVQPPGLDPLEHLGGLHRQLRRDFHRQVEPVDPLRGEPRHP